MSYWSLITLMDLPLALEHLGYLGYNIIENESHANAIHGELTQYFKPVPTKVL